MTFNFDDNLSMKRITKKQKRLVLYGKVTNTGTGSILTVGGGTTTFHDDVVHNGAEIRTSSGARTVFLGAQSGAGNFTGTGTIGVPTHDARTMNSSSNA